MRNVYFYKHYETKNACHVERSLDKHGYERNLKGPRHRSGLLRPAGDARPSRSHAHASVLFFGQGDKKRQMNSVAGFTLF